MDGLALVAAGYRAIIFMHCRAITAAVADSLSCLPSQQFPPGVI
jgi:hypothetical protein